ncbi:MAG: MFS transporter, partial [Nitrospinota bacterium]|nr:MFS transporter [Nitrospinota bacterium]
MNTRYAPHTTNKAAFSWFLLLFFLLNFGHGVLPPLLPPIMGGLGLGFFSAGLLVTAFGLTRFLVDFPAGVLSEKFGVGRIVNIGAALLLAGSALSALADSLPVMLIARGIAGVGSGLTVVFSSIYIIRMGAPDGRVRRGNLYEVAAISGTAVSTILAGEIALRWGWRWGFALAAFVVFLGWLVAAFRVLPGLGEVIWSEGGEESRRPGGPPKISGWTIFILLFMTFSVSVSWSGGITTFLPLYGGKGLGFSSATVGGAMTIALAVTA